MASVVRMMDQFLGVSTPAGNQSHFQRVPSQADADICRRPGTAATVRITEKPWRPTGTRLVSSPGPDLPR